MAKKTSKERDGARAANDTRLSPGVPKGAVARDRYEERLPCKAADADVAAKATVLAKLEHQRSAWRKWWKSEQAKQREKRAYFEERIEELAEEVADQVEYRNVEVVDYLLPTNEVISVRSDTGEVVGTRTAEAEDLQEELPGARSKGPAKSTAEQQPDAG